MLNPFKFQKTYTNEELNLFRFMRHCDLFSDFTEKELELFIPYLYERDYNENEVVFFRGDPSSALYILKEGRVKLNLEVNNAFEEIADLKNRGTVFGDNAILGEGKRYYNAIVKSQKATIYVIPNINIQDLLKNNPKVKAKIMHNLASKYRSYIEQLFRIYQNNYGFFELNPVFSNHSDL